MDTTRPNPSTLTEDEGHYWLTVWNLATSSDERPVYGYTVRDHHLGETHTGRLYGETRKAADLAEGMSALRAWLIDFERALAHVDDTDRAREYADDRAALIVGAV